jgi:hypothetical protein
MGKRNVNTRVKRAFKQNYFATKSPEHEVSQNENFSTAHCP